MARGEPNAYSQNWFRFFHNNIVEDRTKREIDFVCKWAPLPEFRRVLDVCCGAGRHTRELSRRGYAVTGLERDEKAITAARAHGGPEYMAMDVRDYKATPDSYDLVIIMSQSFGYFDSGTNRAVLEHLARGLREGGRVILDLWNPEFFITHQGERELTIPARRLVVRENKAFKDNRLLVRLDYPNGEADLFEWELFTPAQMRMRARSVGLKMIASCFEFNFGGGGDAAKPRIQFVLERAGAQG